MYDFFSDFLNDGFDIFVQGPKVSGGNVCKRCGMSVGEFMRTGKLGCSDCYEAFEPQVKLVLKRIHGNTTHVGKMPKGVSGRLKIKREIEALRTKLSEAIAQEDFEGAAAIRDQIKQLSEGGDGK